MITYIIRNHTASLTSSIFMLQSHSLSRYLSFFLTTLAVFVARLCFSNIFYLEQIIANCICLLVIIFIEKKIKYFFSNLFHSVLKKQQHLDPPTLVYHFVPCNKQRVQSLPIPLTIWSMHSEQTIINHVAPVFYGFDVGLFLTMFCEISTFRGTQIRVSSIKEQS